MGTGASAVQKASSTETQATMKSSLQFDTCDCSKCYKKGDPIPCRAHGVFTLFSMRFCPYSHRVRLVLERKNIPYQLVHVALKDSAPEWLKERNPRGAVPILEKDERSLYDSVVVMQYLDDIKRSNRLTPSDTFEKARQALLIQDFSKVEKAYHDVVDHLDDVSKWRVFTAELEKYESALSGTSGPFMGGYLPSLLDFVVWPFMERLPALERINQAFTLKPAARYRRLLIWQQAMSKLRAAQVCAIDPESHEVVLRSFSTVSPSYGYGLMNEDGTPASGSVSNTSSNAFTRNNSDSAASKSSVASSRLSPASTGYGKLPAASAAAGKSSAASDVLSMSEVASAAASQFLSFIGKKPGVSAAYSRSSAAVGKTPTVSPAVSKSVAANVAASKSSDISAAASSTKAWTYSGGTRKSVTFITGEDMYARASKISSLVAAAELGAALPTYSTTIQQLRDRAQGEGRDLPGAGLGKEHSGEGPDSGETIKADPNVSDPEEESGYPTVPGVDSHTGYDYADENLAGDTNRGHERGESHEGGEGHDGVEGHEEGDDQEVGEGHEGRKGKEGRMDEGQRQAMNRHVVEDRIYSENLRSLWF